eukprot:scaffold31285_cov107-Isochrysis_galbana.AAC.2
MERSIVSRVEDATGGEPGSLLMTAAVPAEAVSEEMAAPVMAEAAAAEAEASEAWYAARISSSSDKDSTSAVHSTDDKSSSSLSAPASPSASASAGVPSSDDGDEAASCSSSDEAPLSPSEDPFTADAFTADAFTADAFTADAFTADAFTADAPASHAFVKVEVIGRARNAVREPLQAPGLAPYHSIIPRRAQLRDCNLRMCQLFVRVAQSPQAAAVPAVVVDHCGSGLAPRPAPLDAHHAHQEPRMHCLVPHIGVAALLQSGRPFGGSRWRPRADAGEKLVLPEQRAALRRDKPLKLHVRLIVHLPHALLQDSVIQGISQVMAGVIFATHELHFDRRAHIEALQHRQLPVKNAIVVVPVPCSHRCRGGAAQQPPVGPGPPTYFISPCGIDLFVEVSGGVTRRQTLIFTLGWLEPSSGSRASRRCSTSLYCPTCGACAPSPSASPFCSAKSTTRSGGRCATARRRRCSSTCSTTAMPSSTCAPRSSPSSSPSSTPPSSPAGGGSASSAGPSTAGR